MAKGEAGVGDRGVINDRDEPCRVRHERAVEERLVAVGESDQIDVAFQIGRLCLKVTHDTLGLPIEAFNGGGQ